MWLGRMHLFLMCLVFFEWVRADQSVQADYTPAKFRADEQSLAHQVTYPTTTEDGVVSVACNFPVTADGKIVVKTATSPPSSEHSAYCIFNDSTEAFFQYGAKM